MRQDFAFVAERALARHAPALMRPGPADADLIEALRIAVARLARGLRVSLVRLCGGEPPEVAIDLPHEATLAEFARPGLHAYSLYSAAPAGVRPAAAASDAHRARPRPMVSIQPCARMKASARASISVRR